MSQHNNSQSSIQESPSRPFPRLGPMGGGGPGHGPMSMMSVEKPRDFKGTLKKLISYLGQYKNAIIIVLFLTILTNLVSIASPVISGLATTKLFEGVLEQIAGTGTGIDFKYISNIIFVIIILMGFSLLFNFIQGWVMTGISMKISYQLRKDIAEKINRMPFKYFDKTSQGEVLSRITNDVDAVSGTLNQSLTQIINSVVTIIGVLIMMFVISWEMTMIAIFSIPLSMIVVILVVRRSQKYFKQQQDYLGHVNGHVEEMFGGHLVVKAFNGEENSVKDFEVYNDTLYVSAWKSQFLSGLMMPIMGFIGNLSFVAIAIFGGYLAFKNAITVGNIQAFISYARSFQRPITQIANISNVLQRTVAAAERVFEFLEEEEEIPEVSEPVIPHDIQGHVVFENVKFGYDPEKIVIKDFSADVQPGQKIAIVGPTGAGKTTMVKLLMRFYDVDSGSILLDGHNIKDFKREDLRCMFGMVLQDTWLYNDSIMENIRFGNPSASDEEVIEAAKAAHVDHYVRTLPEGYNLVLNEEVTNISQGQKQLMTIARAIATNPRILILDEATSSVDTRTEVLIQMAMDNLMQNRTSFIIAHRLSTIRNADLILVMNEGNIVEQGNHDELLERSGFYADLYYSQFDYAEVN
jgi:ATP-binding cassette subfamily B multidrug efflux pump